MIPRLSRSALLGILAVLAASCAPAMTERTPVGTDGNRLPPVPQVLGTLDVEVIYPGEGAAVAARDSTFIFGNVGRGDATLTINGAPVEVAPNGAWLAFLPVPADGVYRLQATANGQTDELVRTVRVSATPTAAAAGSQLRIVEGSVTPRGTLTGFRGEQIEVSFRGTPGAVARLRLPDGTEIPLVERQAVDRRSGFMLERERAEQDLAEYVGVFDLASHIASLDDEVDPPTLTAGQGYIEQRERQAGVGAVVELVRGNEVVQAQVPAAIGMLDPMRPRVAVAATARPDSTVIGRGRPGGDQAWDYFWPNGTLLPIDGEAAGFYRVRLTPDLTAWVAQGDVELLDPATPLPMGFVGPSIQLASEEGWVNVRFSMSERLPFRVDSSEWGISIDFYNATGRPAYLGYGPEDPFIQRVDWDQVTDELFRFNVHLNQPLWGYRYHWEGTSLVLQVRRPPPANPANPLAGLRIAIDAGHRGSGTDTGAVGPTGLTEVEATLWVTQAMGRILRSRGAEVLDLRPDTQVVPLIDRPIRAAEENAQLLVSVHFNAFPDGVNPFENHGTTMFYFWPHSLEFARHLQEEVLQEFGLPDRGVRYQNLAITRTQWMPSVLTETLFMMFPEQEAALRDPAVIERIAEAHVRAMEEFVRERTQVTTAPGSRGL